jgi:hypothetical protein
MTGLVRKATLLVACGLLAASAAMAAVPSPANSTSPTCINLVGTAAGVVDAAGNFSVTVRDLANVPINNSLVVVDFSGCSGLQICDTQPGYTVDCATQTVRGFSGPGGVITFKIAGHANTVCDAAPRNAYNCAKIFADGVLLSSPSAHAFDLNGAGVAPSDLSAWLCDFFGPNSPSRSDYNCSGGTDPADLSVWLVNFFGSGGASGCIGGTQCAVIP